MIPQRNLSLLSNRLARKEGFRIPEAVLERDYCISWFLAGLSNNPLKAVLLFKGGTAIKKCHIGGYRFSEDLDFTLAREISFENIRKNLDTAFERVRNDSGIMLSFSRLDGHSHQNSHTFFMGYEGPLPGTVGKEIKVDVTIQEKIFFPIEERTVIKEYEEYADLAAGSKIQVYSIAEIAAEKVVALLDQARNEPRDLYDIWYLTSHGHIDISTIVEGVKEKWKFRGKILTDVNKVFLQKEARLKMLWEMRLSSQMAMLPEFNGVYREVKRKLRQAFQNA